MTTSAELIDEMNKRGIIHVYAYRRYRHRLDVNGEPIQYVAIIARKEKDVPDSLMADDIE